MSKRGQSIIEYSLIAVLVMLGIVYMGPYVLRSINAHFKLWEDTTQDSFTENITQAPVNDVPNIPINCVCQPDTSSGCGSSSNTAQCGANQSVRNHTCNPLGCDGEPASYCVNDPSCCSIFSPQGCGNVPCPAGGCDTAPTSPPASNNCYFGQQIQAQQCGSNTSIKCVPDTSCAPQCLGVISSANGSPNAVPCPNSTTGLDQNYGITYVANQAACNPITKCQYYCQSPGGNPTENCPAYYVGNTYSGSFMSAHAIWVATPSAGTFPKEQGTLTTTMNVPSSGNYTVTFDVDNKGEVDIDGKQVCSETNNTPPDSPSSCATVALSAGSHSITLDVANGSGPAGEGSVWSENPVGVALTIADSSGNVIFQTGPQGLGQWTSSLACTTGTWDCNSLTCGSGAPTSTLNATGTGCVQSNCGAAPLPTTLPNANEAAQPPNGQNYYFFNYTSHGTQTQAIVTAGFVTPGQTYHLAMVSANQSPPNSNWCTTKGWGQDNDTGDNHCGPLETHNGMKEYICDGDILQNDSSLLHLQVGDEAPNDQHCSEWQILDQNYNVVFAWAGTIDYYMDVAFTPQQCSAN